MLDTQPSTLPWQTFRPWAPAALERPPQPPAVPSESPPLPPRSPDSSWVEALRQREPKAVARLYHAYRARISAVLLNNLGPDDELADIVQEVFVQILKSLPTFRGDCDSLKAWVTRIAVFTGHRKIRSRRRRWWLRPSDAAEGCELADAQASPAVICALQRVEDILQRMPIQERAAFRARIIEGLSLQEAADACNVSLATIKRRLDRARTSFHQLADEDTFLREMQL